MEQKHLAQQATDRLIDYILSNNLQPGEKLPNEFELAQLFGVGRSTLREAVKQLVSRNVLQVRQGAGTFVTSHNFGVAEDPLGLIFIQDKQKLVMDLLDVRMAIEPRIAAMAAMNATQEEIQQMNALAAEVEDLIHADLNHMQKDIELHAAIAQSSRNLVMPTLMPIIQQAISLFVNITNRQLRMETITSHRAVVDAIERRDAVAASDAMTLHLIYNRNNLTQLFQEQADTGQGESGTKTEKGQ